MRAGPLFVAIPHVSFAQKSSFLFRLQSRAKVVLLLSGLIMNYTAWWSLDPLFVESAHELV